MTKKGSKGDHGHLKGSSRAKLKMSNLKMRSAMLMNVLKRKMLILRKFWEKERKWSR